MKCFHINLVSILYLLHSCHGHLRHVRHAARSTETKHQQRRALTGGGDLPPPPISNAWRIRNAVASNGNAWALRGLRFCIDFQCQETVSGQVFDDGSARSWGPAEAIFDDDFSNFWKAFDGDEPGKAFVGLVLENATSIASIAVRPDNVVYEVTEIFVEYLDVDSNPNATIDAQDSWVIYRNLTNFPKNSGYYDGFWYITQLQDTAAPSMVPSEEPSAVPSVAPSSLPSMLPSSQPSSLPSLSPTPASSMSPSVSFLSTSFPSTLPSPAPTRSNVEQSQESEDSSTKNVDPTAATTSAAKSKVASRTALTGFVAIGVVAFCI